MWNPESKTVMDSLRWGDLFQSNLRHLSKEKESTHYTTVVDCHSHLCICELRLHSLVKRTNSLVLLTSIHERFVL